MQYITMEKHTACQQINFQRFSADDFFSPSGLIISRIVIVVVNVSFDDNGFPLKILDSFVSPTTVERQMYVVH